MALEEVGAKYLAPAASKVVEFAGKQAAKGAAWVMGNPVASRIVAGGAIVSGIKDIGTELFKTDPDQRKPWKLVFGGVKVMAGAALAVLNDVEWYGNENLQNVVPVGLPLNQGRNGYAGVNGQPTIHNVVFDITRYVPYDRSNQFYSKMRTLYNTIAGTGRAVQYTERQLAGYMWNIAQTTTVVSEIVRMYGLVNYANSMDSTNPTCLINNLIGKDIFLPDLTRNMANVRYNLSVVANQITNTYPVLTDYVNRANWLVSNVFLDDDNVKAIPILFRTKHMAMYNPEDDSFETVNGVFSPQTMADVDPADMFDNALQYLREIMERYLNLPYLQAIKNDMGAVFGAVIFPEILLPDLGYTPAFSYSEEVLTQIENIIAPLNPDLTHALPMDTNGFYVPLEEGESVHIADINNELMINHGIQMRDPNNINDREIPTIINSPIAEPSMLEQISYTRLCNPQPVHLHFEVNPNGTGPATRRYFDLVADELDRNYSNSGDFITGGAISYSTRLNGDLLNYNPLRYNFNLQHNFIVDEVQANISSYPDPILLRAWTDIDWFPTIYVMQVNPVGMTSTGSSGIYTVIYNAYMTQLFDSKMYARLDYTMKNALDTTANGSLFVTPQLMRVTSNTVELGTKRQLNANKVGGGKSSGNKSGRKNRRPRKSKKAQK